MKNNHNRHGAIARSTLGLMALVSLISGGEAKGARSAAIKGSVSRPAVSATESGRHPDISQSVVSDAPSGSAEESAEKGGASGAEALASSSYDLKNLIQQVKKTPLTMTPRASSTSSPESKGTNAVASEASDQSAATLPSDEPLMPTPVDGVDEDSGRVNEGEVLDGEQDPAIQSSEPIGTPKAPTRVIIPPFNQPIPEQQPAVDAAMKKPTLGCTDILMQSQCFIDPSIKVAYTYVYTLCLMEFSLQKYLESQQYMTNSVRTLEEPAQASLKEIQRVLPSAILGYKLVSDLFQSGQLRDLLDNARQQYQDTKHLNP